MHPALSYHLTQARTADPRRPPGAARLMRVRRTGVAGRLATSRPVR